INDDAQTRRILQLLELVEVSSSEYEESVEGDVPASDNESEDSLEDDVPISDSDCYESDPEDLPDEPQKAKKYIEEWMAKNKTTWYKKNAHKLAGRTSSSTVIKFTAGPKELALNLNSPSWSLNHPRNNSFISRAQ
ncbi:hypothetical protein SK128_020152, partial [Halocaridina rubra]